MLRRRLGALDGFAGVRLVGIVSAAGRCAVGIADMLGLSQGARQMIACTSRGWMGIGRPDAMLQYSCQLSHAKVELLSIISGLGRERKLNMRFGQSSSAL